MSAFTDELLQVLETKGRAASLDRLYDVIDDLLLAKDFKTAESHMVAIAHESRLPVSFLLSALTVSWPWNYAVSQARRVLAEAVHQRESDPELLQGLV